MRTWDKVKVKVECHSFIRRALTNLNHNRSLMLTRTQSEMRKNEFVQNPIHVTLLIVQPTSFFTSLVPTVPSLQLTSMTHTSRTVANAC